jgi:hypothetical protein
MSGSSGATNVAINGGTSGSPSALGAGTYSLQNGGMSIGSAATVTVAAGTSANPTYISEPNGSFSNTGNVTFGAGTIYFNDGPGSGGSDDEGGSLGGGFSSIGTLTFTGGSNSNYYFSNPQSTESDQNFHDDEGDFDVGFTTTTAALAVSGNAAFGPATYYIVNGDLLVNGHNRGDGDDAGIGATVTCPGCGGGVGDTFVLTGTTSSDIGVLQIGSPTTITLSAPSSGTYAGLLIFQDRKAPLDTSGGGGGGSSCQTNCNTVDGGNSGDGGAATLDMTGAIYIPRGAIVFSGGKTSANCLVIIADAITFAHDSTLSTDGCVAAGVVPITTKRVALTQ